MFEKMAAKEKAGGDAMDIPDLDDVLKDVAKKDGDSIYFFLY